MKTILWATLSANGNYARNASPEHPPRQEAFNDFLDQVKATGNFIVGRRTFEGFQAGGESPFGDVDIVVLSKSIKDLPGVKVATSPQEALAYLQAKGHTTALLAGGADLHNTFLQQGLVDEVLFPIAPVLEGKGYNILLNQDHYQYKDIRLLDFKSLGGGVVRLHYEIGHE